VIEEVTAAGRKKCFASQTGGTEGILVVDEIDYEFTQFEGENWRGHVVCRVLIARWHKLHRIRSRETDERSTDVRDIDPSGIDEDQCCTSQPDSRSRQ
jgi:hypothetical protein